MTQHPSGDGAGYSPRSQQSLYAALRGAIGDALKKQYEASAPFPLGLLVLLRRLDETEAKHGEEHHDA